MAKNSVGTRKTPDRKVRQAPRQNAADLPHRGGDRGRPAKTRATRVLSKVEQRAVDMLQHSAMSLREIARTLGKDDRWVRRLRDEMQVERGNPHEIAARVTARSQQQIAEQQAGQPLTDPQVVASEFVNAAAAVLNRQRADQRLARAAVQRLLGRINELLDGVPDLSEALRMLAAMAHAIDDQDLRSKLFTTLDNLHFEPLARTARQLVSSLRDLDAIERIAHGLKIGDDPDAPAGAARPRVAVVPAKAARPADED